MKNSLPLSTIELGSPVHSSVSIVIELKNKMKYYLFETNKINRHRYVGHCSLHEVY
jgi:hypothetical protein